MIIKVSWQDDGLKSHYMLFDSDSDEVFIEMVHDNNSEGLKNMGEVIYRQNGISKQRFVKAREPDFKGYVIMENQALRKLQRAVSGNDNLPDIQDEPTLPEIPAENTLPELTGTMTTALSKNGGNQ